MCTNLPDKLVRVHTFDHDLFEQSKEDLDMLGEIAPLPADIAALAPPQYKLPVATDSGDQESMSALRG